MQSVSSIIYIIVILAVVMIWRGLWGLLDEYLWPNRPRLSYLTSLVIGLILIIILLVFYQIESAIV
ncbi:MAG: hypothetical protein NWE90_02185 [Candidatus Bathyarchaeota archaeon]|nr:hypothetical protein [Candidatus Bathyarchaeota archaeon]